MFDQNENKKISFLPQEDKRTAQEEIEKIKTAKEKPEVEYFFPEDKKVFSEAKKEDKKPVEKETEKNIDKKDKTKKSNFFGNFVKGFKKLFDHESQIKKEKVVPKYNLPEIEIEKHEDKKEIKSAEIEKKEEIFSKPVQEFKKQEFKKEDKKKKFKNKFKKFENKVEKKEEKKFESEKKDFFNFEKKKPETHDKKLDHKKEKEGEKDLDIEKFLNGLEDSQKEFEKPTAPEKIVIKRDEKIEFSTAKYKEDEDAVEISLIPKKERKIDNLFKTNLILTFVWVFIVCVFMGGLYWFSMVQIGNLDLEQARLEEQKKEIQKELAQAATIRSKVQSLENKLNEAKTLLDGHKYWTNLFASLEEYTHSQVRYNGFTGSIDDELVLKASAPNYDVAAKQLLIFQSAKEIAKEVNISGITLKPDPTTGDSQVNFNISLILNDEVFNYKE